MPGIQVAHLAGDEFAVNIRGHELILDQPAVEGGGDRGPTPTELFVAGLVGCVGHYARRFLARHGLNETGLRVTADWEMAADRPARVGRINLLVEPPADFPEDRRTALLTVASHCMVHHSITQAPEIAVRLSEKIGTPA